MSTWNFIQRTKYLNHNKSMLFSTGVLFVSYVVPGDLWWWWKTTLRTQYYTNKMTRERREQEVQRDLESRMREGEEEWWKERLFKQKPCCRGQCKTGLCPYIYTGLSIMLFKFNTLGKEWFWRRFLILDVKSMLTSVLTNLLLFLLLISSVSLIQLWEVGLERAIHAVYANYGMLR